MNHMKKLLCGFECSIWERSSQSQGPFCRHMANYIWDDVFGSFGAVMTFQAHKL